MKTLVKNLVSLMVLEDDIPVQMGPVIVIGSTGRYSINNPDGDIVLYENVDPIPENYRGKMFCYNGKRWTPNNNWRGNKPEANILR